MRQFETGDNVVKCLQRLQTSYQELATLMVALLLLVLIVDRLSRFLRARMGAAVR